MTNFTENELLERIARQRRQRDCREAYLQFFANQRPHAFVTLAINGGVKRLESNREKLAKWAYYINCMANEKSRRVSKLKPEQRLRGWFVNEKQDWNAHWHGLVIFPDACSSALKRLKLSMAFNNIWKDIAKGGNAYTQAIYSSKGAAGYCLKEHFKGDDFYGSLIELSEFWPASKPGRIG